MNHHAGRGAVVSPPDKAAASARERGNLYGFLSAVFRSEPTAALLEFMSRPDFRIALSAAGGTFDDAFFARPTDELLEDLAVEYTALFLGPGGHISPYASVRLDGGEGLLMGPTTRWVMDFITAAGFEYREDYHGLPDHVAVELEFLQCMAEGEARARDESDCVLATNSHRIQRAFIDNHLALWVPRFCDEVIAVAELPFYRELAKVTRDFINDEVASGKS